MPWLKGKVLTNCDKPTEYDIDKVIGETVIELEEAVNRAFIDLTGSKDGQASLKGEAEDHAELTVTNKNLEIKSWEPFNMAMYVLMTSMA